MSLNPKRRLFCQFVVAGCNNTQAALKAGYKESSAKNIGYQLSLLPEIIACIKELRELEDKRNNKIPIKEDVATALLCRDPIQKLIELMNCKDELIEMTAAKALLPYFALKESEKLGNDKLGKKEIKSITATGAASSGQFATLSHQLNNVYEHE